MPKKYEPRTLRLILRVSQAERDQIVKKAEKDRRTISDYLRDCALDGHARKHHAPS